MKNHAKDRINSLEEYIRNSPEGITPNAVNTNSFYSYRHANRLFKALKGESINSFSNKIRLQIAAEYLKYTSESIFDIAIEVGYESTAAFSKAFKKLYAQTPSEFRQTNIPEQLLFNSEKPYYTITHFNDLQIQVFKTTITSDSTVEDFYQNTKDTIDTLNTDTKHWMLLWEEDPELSKVAESPYFIGIPSDKRLVSPTGFKPMTIKGRYAIFETTILTEFAYTYWHQLIYSILDSENKEVREAPYIEWFRADSFHSFSTFIPYKIAVPIQ